MAVSKYLLEDGSGGYLLEDGSGYYITEDSTALVSTLTDNFTSGTRDAAKWTQYNTATIASQPSGFLQFATTTTAGYAGYVSTVQNYDATSSQASIEIVNIGNQSLASLEVYVLQLIKTGDANSVVWWYLSGGLLRPYKKVAGAQAPIGTNLAYDATNHKYLRIREAAGTTYWEYSANGSSWTIHHSEINPIAMSSVYIEISVGVYAVEASGTNVQFDNFNITATSATGQIKTWNGTSFVAKPVKVWNGSAWVTKPLKRWNGLAWITTPY